MTKTIVVTAIEPFSNGHKKRVHMMDTRTGEMYEAIYGDSVTEKFIRLMAPILANKAMKPTKRKGRPNEERV